MRVLILTIFLLNLFSNAAAQTTYIDGETLFTKKDGDTISVLVKRDVGQYKTYTMRIVAGKIEVVEAPAETVSILVREYQIQGFPPSKMLKGYPLITEDAKKELEKFRRRLAEEYRQSDMWVSYHLLKYEKDGDFEYLFIRFDDADRHYGGILYKWNNKMRRFDKQSLVSNVLDEVRSIEILPGGRVVVFQDADLRTKIVIERAPGDIPK